MGARLYRRLTRGEIEELLALLGFELSDWEVNYLSVVKIDLEGMWGNRIAT
jgi:hypothetical protein